MTLHSENTSGGSLNYAWYTVSLCMVAYIFSFIDRQVIALLVEPIRADLQISDTQFSLLHGLAFAIFYAIMGIPIARLADTKSRPLIIAVGVFFWSIATAACGLTRNFWQLFIARMGVGVGEAALSPAAYSMITDLFPKSKLGLALGVYSVGSFLGAGLAFLIGGAAIEWISGFGVLDFPLVGIVKPWQMTFFLVGLPGVFIALIFYLTIRDPARKGVTDESAAGFSISMVLAYIATHKHTFTAHYLGFGFLALSLFAFLSWSPAFLFRNYGLSPKEVGIYLGAMVLISNTSGVLTSGWLTDYFTRKGRDDAAMLSGMIGGLGLIIPGALFSSMPDLHSTLLAYGIAMFFASFPPGDFCCCLTTHGAKPDACQVTALFFLSLNLLGITGGSLLVALSTDYLFKADAAVGYSMSLIGSVSGLTGAIILAWGLGHYAKTVSSVAADNMSDNAVH